MTRVDSMLVDFSDRTRRENPSWKILKQTIPRLRLSVMCRPSYWAREHNAEVYFSFEGCTASWSSNTSTLPRPICVSRSTGATILCVSTRRTRFLPSSFCRFFHTGSLVAVGENTQIVVSLKLSRRICDTTVLLPEELGPIALVCRAMRPLNSAS